MGTECEIGYPYDGAKLHYVLDVDDKGLYCRVMNTIAEYRIRNKYKKTVI